MPEHKKIKVLELIDEAKIGGGQIHLLLLTKYIDKNKFDLYVACEGEGFLVDELKKLHIPVIPVSISNNLKLSNLFDLIAIYNKYNFNIVHSHGGTAGFWGRLAAIFVKHKPILVHTYHGIHYLYSNIFKKYSYILIDYFLNKITDKIVFVCESDYKKGSKISARKKSIIIRNGIEIDNYVENVDREELRAKFGFKNQFVFGNIGRLHRQKGQKYLIEAFAELCKKYSDVLLVIVGDGELYDELKKLTINLDINNKVIFLGSRNDIVDFLNAIDAFVLPSLWEGQPITIFEAMATSKPIIATSVDGVSEILMNMKNALLCPPANVKALSNSMEHIYKDRELAGKLAKKAKDDVIYIYSARQTAKRVSDLYQLLFRKFNI